MTQLAPLISPSADEGAAGNRVAERSNMFVMAALTAGSGSGPVRIRNMSRGGALIEGAVIPPQGSQVRLSRATLVVTGEVVWCRENKAGVRFDCAICVAEWLPGGKHRTGQQRIDEIVFGYKNGAATAEPPAEQVGNGGDVAEELKLLQNSLNTAAEELAGDPAMSARSLIALQAIDMAAQKLGTLAERLKS